MHIFLSSDDEGRPISLSPLAATPITCLGHRTVLARFLARSRDIRSRARPRIRSPAPPFSRAKLCGQFSDLRGNCGPQSVGLATCV